jgi:O-antigen/teichoic acid export membrane protein
MFKNLLQHSIIYGISSILQNAAGFFLLPLYTAYLTVSELGLLEIVIVSISILFTLLQLGLGSALFKYYSYDSHSDNAREKNKLIISSSVYFLAIFSLAAVSSLYFIRQNISELLFGSAIYADLITLMLITVFFQLFWVMPTAYLRIQNKSIYLSILNATKFFIQISITIYAVAVLNGKIAGVVTARVITAILFAFLFTWSIKQLLSRSFSAETVRELLSYSIYLVPVSVGSLILLMSSRYFILLFHDSQALGYFSVANRIATILLLAISGFQRAWPSIMFRIKNKPDAKQYYSKIFSYYLITFSFLSMILTFYSQEIVLLLSNEEYLSAVGLIPILSFSFLFYGFFYSGTVGINIYKKTYYQTIAMVVGAIFNLVLNFILTPAYGIMGTSVAIFISFAIVGLLAFRFSQRIYHIPIEWKRIILLAANLIIVLMLYLIGLQSINPLNFITKTVLLLILFPASLYITGVFTREEKIYLLHRLSNYKQGSAK